MGPEGLSIKRYVQSSAARVLPVLLKAITDEKQKVREQAVIALGNFRAEARGSVPLLVKQFDSMDIELLKASAFVLRNIGGDGAKEAFAVLGKLAGKKDDRNLKKVVTHFSQQMESERFSYFFEDAGSEVGSGGGGFGSGFGGAASPSKDHTSEFSGAGVTSEKKEKTTLLYDGHDFQWWRSKLKTELNPKKRLEAIRVISVFVSVEGADGREAAEAILDGVKGYTTDAGINDSAHQAMIYPACVALIKIGKPAVPVIVHAIEQGDLGQLNIILGCLGSPELEADTKSLLGQQIIPLTNDGNPRIRAKAVRVLSHLKEEEGVWGALDRAVTDESPIVRSTAIVTLFEPSLARFEGTLTATAREYRSSQHQNWKKERRELLKNAPLLVPTLMKALGDEEENVRYQAIRALRRFGPKAKEAVPVLVGQFESMDNLSLRETADTLRFIGGDEGKEALGILGEFAKKKGYKEVKQLVADLVNELDARDKR